MPDIGSVSVRVVPSAKMFVSDFKAQVLPGMRRFGQEAGVEFGSGFKDATRDLNASVNLDTGAADAKLAALRAQVDGVNDAASKGGGGHFNALLAAVVGIGPALIPVAALATGAVGAFGALGLSGALAVKGISVEMQRGTPIGKQYSAGLQNLKADLSSLESVAAKGVLAPFNTAVEKAQSSMPLLNNEVGVFSAQAGRIGGNLFTGALDSLRVMSPLLQDVGNYFEKLSLDALGFADGGGLARFTAWAEQQLPAVEQTLQSLGVTVVHLLEGFSGFGTGSLHGILLLSQAINAIPLPVLKVLVPLIAAGTLGFQAYTGAIKPLITLYGKATTALEAYSAAQLVAAGAGKEAAVANATAGSGLSALVGGLAPVAGIAAVTAVALVGANDLIAKHFRDSAASAADAEKIFEAVGATGTLTAGQLHDLGVQSGNLNTVINTAFNESTLGKIRDFQFGLGSIIQTPWNSSTDDMKNFFKSSGDGLTAMVSDGKVNAAKSLLQDMSTQTGVSVNQLLSKMPQLKTALSDLAATAPPIHDANGVLLASSDTLQKLAGQYGITTDQAQTYASMMGITSDAVKNSTVSEATLAGAIGLVSAAEGKASATTTEYIQALVTFEQSAHAAADRASLISAILKNANGDNLAYAGSMNQAATANQALVTAMAAGALKTVNFKTGLIDFNNAAASPLISALDQLQTASLAAAAATYQHELATKSGTAAGDDAYNTYVSRTQGALVDEAEKFGLTTTQAKKFADQYFGLANAPDIKKKIEQVGGKDTQTILSSIDSTLKKIAGVFTAQVSANIDPAATKNLTMFDNLLNTITTKPRTVSLTVNTTAGLPSLPSLGSAPLNTYGGGRPPGKAGGGLLPEGFSTVNEQGWELLHKSGSNVQVYSHSDSMKLLPQGPSVPAFASGTSGNPFTGIDFSAPGSASSSKKAGAAAKAAAKAVESLANARANIRFTTSLDLSGLQKAAGGSASGIAAILRKLITDVHAAEAKGLGSNALITQLQVENHQLQGLATERATISGKLKAANNLLTAERKLFSDEQAKVAGSVAGNFDITSLNSPTQFATANPAAFLQNLQIEAGQVNKFTSQLAGLRKSGLNKSLIQQLGEAGVAGGGAAAQSLASASPQQIAQINALFAQVNKASGTAGSTVAGSLYQAGVDSAVGYVNGLNSQLTQVDKAATKLANTVISQIKKTLGIKSPSTVAHGLAGYTVAGYVAGVDDRLHLIRGAASRMANAAVTPAQFTTGQGDGTTGGRSVFAPITVNPSPGMNEEAVGEAAARRVMARFG